MDSDSRFSEEKYRKLYKATTPPWKETYRNRCIQRFKHARGRLVDSFRSLKTDDGCRVVNMDDGLVPQIIDEEWQSLQNEKVVDDSYLIDQYDLIKNEVLQELKDQEQNIVSQYLETLKYEELMLENALHDQTNKVLCPVCQKNWLQQNMNVIRCNCGLNLDTEDCMTLEYLKGQLQVGLITHNENCQSTPVFSYTLALGMTNLLMTCSGCDFIFIVI